MPAISFEDPLEVNKWTKKLKKIFFYQLHCALPHFHWLTEINDKDMITDSLTHTPLSLNVDDKHFSVCFLISPIDANLLM